MVDFEEMKEKYPRAMTVVQGLSILAIATGFSLILISPIYIFDISTRILVDIFTFPADVIPQPYNLVGILFIPVGMLLIIWANYALLHIGKIGLRDREPMQTPSNLVLVGPFRFTRNPIYFGCLLMLLGLVIVWSSLITALLLVLVYVVFRYVFIKKEETILETEFGDEYRDFKKRVRRMPTWSFAYLGEEVMTEIPMPERGPSYRTPGERTTGILLVIIVQILLGLLFMIFGILFVGSSYTIAFTIGGAASILVGVLMLFDSYGLWNTQSWAWIMTILTNILHFGVYLFYAIATGMPVILGIGQMVISIMIVIYFVLPTTREQFGV
ncbi:MAG: methyltransferase [Candidatus Thorarchaeota archaeon]